MNKPPGTVEDVHPMDELIEDFEKQLNNPYTHYPAYLLQPAINYLKVLKEKDQRNTQEHLQNIAKLDRLVLSIDRLTDAIRAKPGGIDFKEAETRYEEAKCLVKKRRNE